MSVSDENLLEQFSLMARNKKSPISGRNHLNEPIFFLPQNVSQDHFHKIGKFKKIAKKILKSKGKILENIVHSLDALLPWQRPIATN